MAIQDVMSLEDMKLMESNKLNYHNAKNQTQKDVAELNNTNILAHYGLTQNDNVSLGELQKYIADAEKQQNYDTQRTALLTNITNKTAIDPSVRDSANAIKNFRYDPTTDPAYQSYVDMYNRQGQSAAKQTINNLNASNMGRNSSYSAAATAQVQQAYAQKASEMIPTLAQQAYEKLMNNYSINKDISDTEYNRQLTAYQVLADDHTRGLTDRGLELSNKGAEYNNEQTKLNLKYYEEMLQQQVAAGYLSNEQAAAALRSAKVQAEVDETYGMSNAGYENQIYKNNAAQSAYGGYSSGGSSGGSGSSSKELNKRNMDASISNWLYSDALNPDGTGIWQGTSSRPQYYAVDKMNNAEVVSGIIDSLISSGYTYAQALDKIEEYKTNITIETMKIEGKQGWDDKDVVQARKNVLFR